MHIYHRIIRTSWAANEENVCHFIRMGCVIDTEGGRWNQYEAAIMEKL